MNQHPCIRRTTRGLGAVAINRDRSTNMVDQMIEQFRTQSARMVFVVDEYGVVQGLMTPHDLLEAITGELQPHAQTDAWATRRDEANGDPDPPA